MNEEEIDNFLNRTQPPLLGVIATIDKTGYPNALPVWYRYNKGCIRIWTDMGRAWPNDIVRNPKVSFSVQDGGEGHRGRVPAAGAERGADGEGGGSQDTAR